MVYSPRTAQSFNALPVLPTGVVTLLLADVEGSTGLWETQPAVMASALAAMDEWNQKTHGRSGLIDRVRASALDEAAVETLALEFLKKYSTKGHSPMCGNSIGQDRRFMARHMPTLEGFFHYRNLDVSTLKELCRRWQPEVYKGFKKKGRHTALADIHESIDELRYYREHFLRG